MISDHRYWRIISKVKASFGEPIAEIKEAKMKEISCLQKINWSVDIETCEKIEKSMKELVDEIFSKVPADTEEKQFVRNTIKTIEDTLKRESVVRIDE